MNTVIKTILQEGIYRLYAKDYPEMVKGIRKLIIAGEKPKKIKAYCKSVVGNCITAVHITYVIDYINKEIKN